MLVGYNTNIPYKGSTYHVQTEDSGPKNPVIITLLYQKGAILASKKTGYSHLLSESDLEKKIEAMMKSQHKSMIKELLSGKYTGDAQPEEAEAGPAPEEKRRSLDDILVEFIVGGGKT